MVEDPDKEKAKKVLAIALDMHQAKELRIQAVRVLKAMGAIDELWTVVQNVKCPFTKQSAIDSIPALGVKIPNEQDNSQKLTASTVKEAEPVKEVKTVKEVNVPSDPPKMNMTDLEKRVLSYLYTLWTKGGVEGVSLNIICQKTEIQAPVVLPTLEKLANLKFVKKMFEEKRGWTRELFGITDEGIKYAKLNSLTRL
jgi:hypothetical protein